MSGQDRSGDTLHNRVSLDSVVVYGRTTGGSLRSTGDGTLLWNMRMMDELPRLFGNADPLHYAQMLPGVSMNGEYDAGLHVLGCESSHNYISIDGAPLYGVSHLLGFFSVFNPSHFQQMNLRKTLAYGSSPDCLGAEITMQTFYQPTDSVAGEMALGPMSSQGTVRIPVTGKSELALSMRASYMNLLYSGLMKGDDSSLKYSFYDVNVTYNHVFDDSNRLRFNFYMGDDDATMDDAEMSSSIGMRWKNTMASLQWQYDNGCVRMSDVAYYTRTESKGALNMVGLNASLPASMYETGNRYRLTWRGWTAGADIARYCFKPQSPLVSSEFMNVGQCVEENTSSRLSVFLDKEWRLSGKMSASTGLRGTHYHAGDNDYIHLSPSAGVTFHPADNVDLIMCYAYQHQYLTKTGMTTINTPFEFWLSAGTYGLQPQTAHSLNFAARYTSRDCGYTVSLEAYTKWLDNQTEYNGTIYSIVSSNYDLRSMLLNGRGHNYGLNVMLMKNRGWLTGWVTYAIGRSMRTYCGEVMNGTFPSSHERIHEVDCVLTFHLGRRVDIGMTGVWATGTPFTAPKQYYLMNQFIVTDFASRNSNRLKPYYRADVSVNYRLTPTRRLHEHGLNLSLYNITANEHELFYYVKVDNGKFSYKSMKFFMRMLPSVSYYMKF